FLLGDMLQDDVGGRPIGAEQREVPLEYRAVARLRTSVAHGDKRNLVERRLFRQRKGDAGREREYICGAGWAFALQPLVALDAAVGGIAGVAFLDQELDAVDAAVALVDELVVVGDAIRDWDTVGCIGASAVDEVRDELLVLRKGWHGECRDANKGRKRYPDMFSIHRLLH